MFDSYFATGIIVLVVVLIVIVFFSFKEVDRFHEKKKKEAGPSEKRDLDSEESTRKMAHDLKGPAREGLYDFDAFKEEGLSESRVFTSDKLDDSEIFTSEQLEEISEIFKKLAISCLFPIIGSIWWVLLTNRLANLVREAGQRKNMQVLKRMANYLTAGLVFSIIIFPLGLYINGIAYGFFAAFFFEYLPAPEKHKAVKLSLTISKNFKLILAGLAGIAFMALSVYINSLGGTGGDTTGSGWALLIDPQFLRLLTLVVSIVFIIFGTLALIHLPVSLHAFGRWLAGVLPGDLGHTPQRESYDPRPVFGDYWKKRERRSQRWRFYQENMIAFKHFKTAGAYVTRDATMNTDRPRHDIHEGVSNNQLGDKWNLMAQLPWFW